MMPGVEKVVHIMQPFKLVSREAKSDDTIIKLKCGNRWQPGGNNGRAVRCREQGTNDGCCQGR